MSTEETEATQRRQRERPGLDPLDIAGARPVGFPTALNETSRRIIGAAMEVHSHLGAGLRERLYETALVHEMRERGLLVDQQVPFVAVYKGKELPAQVIDTIVETRVVLELKSVRQVVESDHAQLNGYLQLTGLPLGLLLNFGEAHLRDGIFRKINFPPFSSPSVRLKPTPAIQSILSVSSVSPP